jgi:hypothetical protein
MVLAVLVGLLCAAPAGAVVVAGGPQGKPVGLAPLAGSTVGTAFADPLDGTNAGVTYHGGPVMHSETTYAVFWDPAGAFQAGTEQTVANYLQNVAHDSGGNANVFSVAGQYADAAGNAAYSQSYGGTLIDRDPYPAGGGCSTTTGTASTCLWDSQLLTELQSFITARGLPIGMSDMYVVLTPDTVVTCMDGGGQCSTNSYCSLHSYATEGSSTLLYLMIPFTLLDSASDAKSCQEDGNANVQEPQGDPGFADVAIKALTHEMLETVTDPLLNAWYDAAGNEIADICNGTTWNPESFLPTEGGSASAGTLYDETINGAHYYLQGAWSNQADACQQMSSLEPTIGGVPASVARGTPVALSATAGTGAAIASYTWNFGDGQSASGQSVTHSYTTGGTYNVTLTVTDSFGNSGTTSESIDVTNPPGTTAGSSGSSGSDKLSSHATTRCGDVRHGRRGRETRHCTTTTVTTRAGNNGAKQTTKRRRACLYARTTASAPWSREACSASVIVAPKRA